MQRRRRCERYRRVRRARAGFEIDRSERSSRVAISRAAGPDGARNTNVTTSKHAAAPPERRTRPGCWWAASGPGRALRRRAEPHVSDRPPQVWRAPEGPEGTGGLRDRPLRAKLACGDLAGGRGLRRPQHQRHHKQTRTGRPPPTGTHSGSARRTKRAAARQGRRAFTQLVHTLDTVESWGHSTQSRGRAFSAVAQPRPRRPGPR